MSLRVWLPLTKDLRNQGLDDVTVTNNGATFNSAGKLGGCYYFNRSIPNYLKITNPLTTATNGVSIAFWVKLPSNGSVNDQLVHIGNGSGWTNNRFTCFVRGGNSTLIFACGDGTNSTRYKCASSALTLNQWTHVVCLYENNKMKIYLNGALNKEYSTTIVPSFTNVIYIGIGAGPNATEPATAYLNDVRIYDHALSSLEIKEISKGLILHYPLNRNGWGNENLLVDTYNWSTLTGTSTVSEGYWYSNGGTAVRGYDNINNITYCKIWHSDSSSQTRYSRQYITMQPNTYYTVSILCRINTDIAHLSIRNDRNEAITFFALNVELTNKNWEWKFFTAKTHTNTSQEPFTIYAQVNSDGVLSSDTSIDIAMIKLEEGSIATPWCPNSSDAFATTMGLNDNIEYDTSGYENNGTRIGTFSWTSNTPKHAVSQVFNGTNNAIQTPSLPSMISDKNYTIAVWIYKTVIGSKGYQTIYGGPSGFEIEARNGGANETKFVPWNWGKPMASYELNEWNHCVFVHSDSDCKIYLNGEYIATGTAKASNPSGNYFVGAWNTATQQNFDGLMSDFRIYATALSADDVKSLYQNSAYIDNQGNIYGALYEEV